MAWWKSEKVAIVIGDEKFEFPVVGESHHQTLLEDICGGRTEDGANHKCAALLVPEPKNPYDKNAVAVTVDGKTVGYLARDVAPDFLTALASGSYESAACGAIIVGGWSRDGDEGHFGIRLNAALPFTLADPPSR
jgi:hypothetical protein